MNAFICNNNMHALTSALFILFTCLAGVSISQNTAKQDVRRFKGVFTLGLNASQIEGDGFAGYNRLGVVGGAGALYRFNNPKFSFSMEINYSMKGSQTSFRPNVIYPSRKIALHYAELPLLFNFHERDRAIFSLGFTYGQRVYSKETGLDGNGAPIAPNPNESHIRKSDYAVMGSVVFIFKKKYGINLRGSYSFIPALRYPSTGGEYVNWHNNVLSLRAFYIL